MKNLLKARIVPLIGIIAFAAVIVFSTVACKGKSAESSGSAVESAAASSSNKIDDLLTDYEKFVDDYTALVTRILAGDVSAAIDASKLEDQIKDWAAKWEGVSESDFTPAQALKMQELAAKSASAFGN